MAISCFFDRASWGKPPYWARSFLLQRPTSCFSGHADWGKPTFLGFFIAIQSHRPPSWSSHWNEMWESLKVRESMLWGGPTNCDHSEPPAYATSSQVYMREFNIYHAVCLGQKLLVCLWKLMFYCFFITSVKFQHKSCYTPVVHNVLNNVVH